MNLNTAPLDQRLPRTYLVILVVVILIAARILLAVWYAEQVHFVELLNHVILVVLAAVLVHLIDRSVIFKEVIQENKLVIDDLMKRNDFLLAATKGAGIVNIFKSRKEVQEEVTKAVLDGKRKIWLLGVGLNEGFDLDAMIPVLRHKKKDHVDIRIMMLDAFRSTSVFRTFLENDPEMIDDMIADFDRADGQFTGNETYFTTDLCRKFVSICRKLERSHELIADVKFYAHTPICWMVMVDDTVYFQPYVFGAAQQTIGGNGVKKVGRNRSGPSQPESIGDLMPVFAFKEKASPTYDILNLHFRRLWSTSDEDLFTMAARLANKSVLVKKIFEQRLPWFKHVRSVLNPHRSHSSGQRTSEDDRRFPRKNCPGRFAVTFKVKTYGIQQPKSGVICDYSRNGLSITMSNSGDGLAMGNVLLVENAGGSLPHDSEQYPIAAFVLNELLGSTHEYEIVHKSDNRIGLKRVPSVR